MDKLFFPEIVQIQTSSFCNANCTICPYFESSKTNPAGFMNEELFKKIILECSKYKPKVINIFLMNEPLMDKRIVDWIEFAKENNPSSIIDISTNASLLNKELALKIIGSSLDSITISFHSSNKDEYVKLMKGLDFDKTLENIRFFIMKNGLSKKKKRIVISMKHVKNNKFDNNNFKHFCEENGVIIHEGLISNRGGNVKNYDSLVNKSFLAAPFCKRPFGYIGILFDGKVVACCVDYYRERIMGDVSKSSILDVWNNKKYEILRDNFNSNCFEKDILCKDCRINSSFTDKRYI